MEDYGLIILNNDIRLREGKEQNSVIDFSLANRKIRGRYIEMDINDKKEIHRYIGP